MTASSSEWVGESDPRRNAILDIAEAVLDALMITQASGDLVMSGLCRVVAEILHDRPDQMVDEMLTNFADGVKKTIAVAQAYSASRQ